MKQREKSRGTAKEIAYIGLSVALITVCAWTSVPVFSVPFTLQTLAVALVGGLFGVRRGLVAVSVYVLAGLVGIPVFAGFKAGGAALFGPTGGYILGFAFLALLPALFKHIPVKGKTARFFLCYAGAAAGCAVCYLFGTVWFTLMYGCSFWYALSVCVIPYLLPDACKFVISSLLTGRLEHLV